MRLHSAGPAYSGRHSLVSPLLWGGVNVVWTSSSICHCLSCGLQARQKGAHLRPRSAGPACSGWAWPPGSGPGSCRWPSSACPWGSCGRTSCCASCLWMRGSSDCQRAPAQGSLSGTAVMSQLVHVQHAARHITSQAYAGRSSATMACECSLPGSSELVVCRCQSQAACRSARCGKSCPAQCRADVRAQPGHCIRERE